MTTKFSNKIFKKTLENSNILPQAQLSNLELQTSKLQDSNKLNGDFYGSWKGGILEAAWETIIRRNAKEALRLAANMK